MTPDDSSVAMLDNEDFADSISSKIQGPSLGGGFRGRSSRGSKPIEKIWVPKKKRIEKALLLFSMSIEVSFCRKNQKEEVTGVHIRTSVVLSIYSSLPSSSSHPADDIKSSTSDASRSRFRLWLELALMGLLLPSFRVCRCLVSGRSVLRLRLCCLASDSFVSATSECSTTAQKRASETRCVGIFSAHGDLRRQRLKTCPYAVKL